MSFYARAGISPPMIALGSCSKPSKDSASLHVSNEKTNWGVSFFCE